MKINLFILIGVLLFIFPFTWFDNSHMVFFHDEGIPLNKLKALDFTSIWSGIYEFGTTSPATSKSLGFSIYILLSSIFGYSIAEKLIYSLLFLIGYIGFYLLAKKYIINKDNQLLISFIFIYIYFSFEIIYSVYRVNYIFSRLFFLFLFPLLIYLFLELITSFSKKKFFLFTLVSFLFNVGLGHPSTIILLLLLLFPLIILTELYFNNKLNIKTIKRSLIMFIVLLLILSFSLIPKFLVFSESIENLGGGKEAINLELKDYSKYHSIETSLSQYPIYPIIAESTKIDWYKNEFFFEQYIFRALLFLPIIVLVYSLIFKPQKKIVFYFITFLILVFLSKGLNNPFGFIYKFVIDNSSIFDSFRYLEKWTIILPFLSGIILLILLQNLKEKKKMLYLFSLLIIAIPLLFTFSIFIKEGSLFSNSKVNSINQEVSSIIPIEEFNKLITINDYLRNSNEDNEYRILFYPPFEDIIYLKDNKGNFYIKAGSANPFNLIFDASMVSTNKLQSKDSTKVWKEEIAKLKASQNSSEFCKELSKYNFKYIISSPDFSINNECLSKEFSNDRYTLYKNKEWNKKFIYTLSNNIEVKKNFLPNIYTIQTPDDKIYINWEYRRDWVLISSDNLFKKNYCDNTDFLSFTCKLDSNKKYYLVFYKSIIFYFLIFVSLILFLILTIFILIKNQQSSKS